MDIDTEELYNKTIAFYNTQATSYADSIESRIPLIEIEKFIMYMNDKRIVLDVGCAAGRDTRVLAQRGFDVTGIDLSDGLIQEAKKRSPYLNFQIMDMMHMTFLDTSFEGIYASASLLHLPTNEAVEQALQEFCRVLIPKGILHVRVKERKDTQKDVEMVSEPLSGNNPRLMRFFSQDQLASLLETNNFFLKEIYTYNNRDRQHLVEKTYIPDRDTDWISAYAMKLPQKEMAITRNSSVNIPIQTNAYSF